MEKTPLCLSGAVHFGPVLLGEPSPPLCPAAPRPDHSHTPLTHRFDKNGTKTRAEQPGELDQETTVEY